ncbi:RHS repeat-associated core domain-containing protein [Trinickia diaoshuihuensis]|uniref:RHS repeat-associated core domain-containing protein n=1 Tax=Trinickia diaoshuihuensis TaxID=2292265 RepID=UPI000E27CD57|nr:RHS repeat-associated core domain-containing protein [Trinickia diaoshuihuensis]
MATIQLRFTGAYLEPAIHGYPLGNGYRWYLPGLMRFNAPDHLSPFGRGGVNPYVYCAADPVNHRDPSGHMIEPEGTAIINFIPSDPDRLSPREAALVHNLFDRALQAEREHTSNAYRANQPEPSGAIAADQAAAANPASPPAKRPRVGPPATEPLQPPSTSKVASTAGPAQSLRFHDRFDRAQNNPTRVPGPGRSNQHMNTLYSFAQDLDADGMTLYSLGQYKLTLARRLNFPTEKALNDRIYNEYSMATDDNRRQAFRLIAGVIGTKLPEQ